MTKYLGYHVGYRGNFYSFPTYEEARAKYRDKVRADPDAVIYGLDESTYQIQYGEAIVSESKLLLSFRPIKGAS